MTHTVELETLFNTMMQLGKLMSQCTQESQEERVATMLQFSALSFIYEEANLTVTELSDSLKLSKSSTTQLIDRLVTAEMVEKVSDTKDKRITRVVLTGKGEEERIRLKHQFLSTLDEAFADIPKSDILELIRIHAKMINSLKTRKHEQN